MPPTRLLLSSAAETARSNIMQAFGSYEAWRFGERQLRPRLAISSRQLQSPLGSFMVVAQMVAVAEHFSLGQLVDCVYLELDGGPQVAPKLWRRVRNRVESTWREQKQAWADFFDVKFNDAPQFAAIEPYIEVRNAIMHGLGRLTRRQMDDRDRVYPLLSGAGISAVGGQIGMTPQHVATCRDACSNFVIWLDIVSQGVQTR